MGSLNVVDSHREKREARQVDQRVDDGSHSSARGAEAEVHLQEEVYRHKKAGLRISSSATTHTAGLSISREDA